MKIAKFNLMFLACAAAFPAFAQNTGDSYCGITNLDRNRNMFTIVNPNPGMVNQQCFITVVAKDSWPGGAPDLTTSQLVEGNYEITLSGGGGGGGGGATRVGGGGGGAGAVPFTTVRYLKPGVYRLTIGTGGQGGGPNGGKATDGAPTSLSEAYSGETVAGFSRAEYWNGSYPWSYASNSARTNQLSGFAGDQSDPKAGARGGQGPGQPKGGDGGRVNGDPRGQDGERLLNVAYSGMPGKGGTDLSGRRFRNEVGGGGGGGAGFGNGGNGDSAAENGKAKTGAMSGELGGGGGGGAGGEGIADSGAQGGNGFIKLALADPVPQAAAPVQAAPAAPEVTPAPPAARPARRDRN